MKKFKIKGLASVKALEEKGVIEAYVSIFGNIDQANEIVEKGAFKESLATKMPKVVWSHDWNEVIGVPLEATEDEKGLRVKFQLILDVQRAKEAYALIKAGAVDEFSIGYKIEEDDVDEKGVRHLRKLRLYEISPVLVGCNDKTEVISVKSGEEKDDSEEEPEEKGEVSDVVDDRDKREEKWEKIKDVNRIMDAFWTAYFDEETEVKEFDAMLTETIGLLGELVGEAEKSDKVQPLVKDANPENLNLSRNREIVEEAMKILQSVAVFKTAHEAPTQEVDEEEEKKDDSQTLKIIRREARKGVKSLNQVLFTIKRIEEK
jgi:HK97 family phage prohead protease